MHIIITIILCTNNAVINLRRLTLLRLFIRRSALHPMSMGRSSFANQRQFQLPFFFLQPLTHSSLHACTLRIYYCSALIPGELLLKRCVLCGRKDTCELMGSRMSPKLYAGPCRWTSFSMPYRRLIIIIIIIVITLLVVGAILVPTHTWKSIA